MMRILVCGGRTFQDYAILKDVLDAIHQAHPIEMIIQGGARGADALAHDWASENAVRSVTVHADWQTHGRAAGPIRNQKMLDQWTPDLVIAFPGGRGTADMVRRAKVAGVMVREIVPVQAEVVA